MESKDDPPLRSSNLGRPIVSSGGGDASLTSSSTSSASSLSVSPPDFLRQVNAAFKRHRPLGTMQSNISRASRVLVTQKELSRKNASTSNNANRKLPQVQSHGRAARLLRKDIAARIGTDSSDDSSVTPPRTGTMNIVQDEKIASIGMQKEELAACTSHPMTADLSAEIGFKKGGDVQMIDDTIVDDMSSYMRSLALTEGKGHLGSQAATTDQDLRKQGLQNMETLNSAMKFEESGMTERENEPRENQNFFNPIPKPMVVGSSSCLTTMSVHSGPTFQCTHAPLTGQTAVPTQTSCSAVQTSLGDPAASLHEGPRTIVKEGDGLEPQQRAFQPGDCIKDKVISDNIGHLQAQVPSASFPTSNIAETSQTSKVEKSSRKKRYDSDVFFKVNGKHYQKLGKIGSGGSSEVHKVISSDCAIYALKKIKLKGRDYPTAYGFCQEIEYLKKLKGKSNIIQLIDYEVTDKTLLQEVTNGSLTKGDAKIKDDQYIYMVLEYGEIDLANMLSQKWKEIDSSRWEINENWLRFYWQQMLEAVNTIHEERIVHSDLKPANFLLVRGSLKLIDFGIAKAILSDTTNIQRDAQVGTLNYMSPEAYMCTDQDSSGNTIKCGRPSDIWSLGCILYQMVYGKTPFSDYKTFWAKFKVITDKNHSILFEPVSNPWLVDLMKRCLAWDRNERWRIPQLLKHPFLAPPVMKGAEGHCGDFFAERVALYINDPDVKRLYSELHEVVANLERGRKD